MSTRKFTEEDIDEMIFLAQKFGSYRKAALEFGCSYQTVADRCHKRGVHIAGPHELCKKKKQLVVDGHTFYWATIADPSTANASCLQTTVTDRCSERRSRKGL